MGDDRRELDLSRREAVQEGLEVSRLGPSNVAGRVVDPFFLESGIVPPGPYERAILSSSSLG